MTKHLLVVEDDAAISHLIEQILRIEGYTSTAVSEGRRAMDVLRSRHFDVVILDVMLPGMDGIAILKEIRDDRSLSELPVIMLTAKTDDETTWAGWRAGCNYYMTKPFEPDDLLAILKELEPVNQR